MLTRLLSSPTVIVKLAIFDMDGTLYRSESSVLAATRQALEEFGLPPVADETILSLVGERMLDYCKAIAPALYGDEIRRFARRINEIDTEILGTDGVLYEGTHETLDALRDDGFKLAVCTHAGTRYAEEVLGHFGILEKLAHLKTADEGLTKAEQVRWLIETTGAEFAVMVGDSVHDFDAAVANRIPFIAAMYGYRPDEIASADYPARSVAEAAAIARDPALPVAMALYARDARDRARAAVTLRKMGTDARRAARALKHVLCDEDARVRVEAAEALAVLGEHAEPMIGTIAKLVETDSDALVRAACVEALGKLARLPEITVPVLARSLLSEDQPVRRAAAWGLRQFGHDAAPAVSELIAALGSDDAMLVRRALLALSAIGAASIDALPHVDAVMSLYANAQTPSDLKMLDAATNAHRSLRGEKPLPPLKVCGVKDVEKSESGVS